MKKNFAKFALAAVAAVGLTIMTPVDGMGSEPLKQSAALEAMAKTAETAKEHANVAKQYRLRAEQLEVKAAKHEADASAMRKRTNPMSHKWPAMVSNSWQRESELAVQTRRAAQECQQLAAKHVGLAVEAQQSVD